MPNRYELRSTNTAAPSDSKPVITHSTRSVASGSGVQHSSRADGTPRPVVVRTNRTRPSQPRSRAAKVSDPKRSPAILHQVHESPKFKPKTAKPGSTSTNRVTAATGETKPARHFVPPAARSPSLVPISPKLPSGSGKTSSRVSFKGEERRSSSPASVTSSAGRASPLTL